MKLLRGLAVIVPVGASCSLYYLINNHTNPYSNKVYAQHKNLQLQQIQVLFRHGARTPIFIPSAGFDRFTNIGPENWSQTKFVKPEIDFVLKSLHDGEILQPKSSTSKLLGDCFCGDLTTLGQKEADEFGKWLNDEYIGKRNFISPTYTDDNSVYIRSTPFHRAVYTAVGVIEGLYGKANLQEPFTIWTLPNDHIIALGSNTCAAIKKRVLYEFSIISEDQKRVNKEMGIKEGVRFCSFFEINDIVTQRLHHGLHVPQYLLDEVKLISDQAMIEGMNILGNTESELRNSVGALAETLCSEIEEAVAGKSKHRVILYASHDTTILCLQKVLGNFNGEWPPFLANMIIELYKDEENKHFIRVLYNKKPLFLDEEGMEEYLSIERFMELMEKYRVVDWNADCGNVFEA